MFLVHLKESFYWERERTNSECLVLHKSNHKAWVVAFQGENFLCFAVFMYFCFFPLFFLKFKERIKPGVHPFYIKNILYWRFQYSFHRRLKATLWKERFLSFFRSAHLWKAEDIKKKKLHEHSSHKQFKYLHFRIFSLKVNVGLGFKNNCPLLVVWLEDTYGDNKKKHSQR